MYYYTVDIPTAETTIMHIKITQKQISRNSFVIQIMKMLPILSFQEEFRKEKIMMKMYQNSMLY